MDVGITGTREGMTDNQRQTLRALLVTLSPVEGLHHGDCIGADETAHWLALSLDIPVTIWPPVPDTLRAHCAGAYRTCTPRPCLERNRMIADHSTVLLALPRGYCEELRSGTWATVRYARRLGRPVAVIWPDGRCEWENLASLKDDSWDIAA